MQLSSIPISVNTTDIDIKYLEQNISQLKELMTLIFRKPLGCHIVKTTKLAHNQLAIIHMTAVNPATDQIWSQQINIYEGGALGINGGQPDAAWRCKPKYLNKTMRIIRFWLSENDGRKRSEKRTHLIAQELFERTFINSLEQDTP
jgi:hypothetical protein